MKKIALVVDDSTYARTFIGSVLSEVGYDVRLAADGHEALEICEPVVDLLVTDLSLPRIGGLQLLEKARQGVFGPGTLCVVCSPLTELASVAQRLSQFDRVATVSKPCVARQLVEAIRTASRHRAAA